MKSVAINFRAIAFNLTILNDYDVLFYTMQQWEKFWVKLANEGTFGIDLYYIKLRHDLKDRYKIFLKDPSLRTDANPEWKKFIDDSIQYFFAWAFIYDKPIYLVDVNVFDKVIQKGIYVNLTNSDKPDLIEGIPYVKYTKVGGR